MTRVLVAVPAHDEADEIGECLRSVVAAARAAIAAGVCDDVQIGVGLNRCSDRTAEVIAEVRQVTGHHVHAFDDPDSRTVGAVRARLVRSLVELDPPDTATTWLFNTDADSRVPPDWISRTVVQVGVPDVRAVAGMVELRDWTPSTAVRTTYDAILAAGMVGSAHTHVYGANLAVRLDAYERVGGFRSVHAEDRDLVDRLRLSGEHVAARLTPLVSTSSRAPGRAEAGLGALLQRLGFSDAVASPVNADPALAD